MEKQLRVLGFYHENGIIPAWKLASDFAGKDGRIGTLLDVVNARIEHDYTKEVWNTYYTTLSAEYVGYGKNGNLILIVAHGIGPMSSIEGIKKAYSHCYKDTERIKKGGRISQEEFLDLEAGKYGKVAIVDLKEYINSRQHPFIAAIPEQMEELDPVVRARLGDRCNEYITRCRSNSTKWIENKGEMEDFNKRNLQILEMEDGNISYVHVKPEKDFAFAHLLSVGRLTNMYHSKGISLMHDIACHDWTNGVRLIGIRGAEKITNILPGFNYQKAVKNPKSREALMVKLEKTKSPNKMSLFDVIDDNVWFTQTPKIGEEMNTGILEYSVRSVEPIGGVVKFRTKITGYHMFVRYGLSEVQSIAPENANGYRLLDAEIIRGEDGTEYHEIKVRFYKIDVDTSRRIMTEKEILKDAKLLESIINLYNS